MFKVRPGCQVVSPSVADGGIWFRRVLGCPVRIISPRIPIHGKVRFRKPGRAIAFLGMVEPGAQASEVDRILDEHRRSIDQPARDTVSRLKPRLGDPFDLQFFRGWSAHNDFKRSRIGSVRSAFVPRPQVLKCMSANPAWPPRPTERSHYDNRGFDRSFRKLSTGLPCGRR